MIYYLQGKILKKGPDSVVLLCGGVGYLVQVPPSVAGALPGAGGEGSLYTYLNLSENDISLFGFATEEQRACFEMLIGVSGVGPRVGLSILSVLTPERVALAISAEDHKAFTAASGVGPKLAKRITLELKDKVGKGLAAGLPADMGAAPVPSDSTAQAMAAMLSLGYSQSEAARVIAQIDETLPVAEIVRLALRQMGRR